jgi:hypothetical protein
MVATRAIQRAVVDSRNPLQHEGLREHIFSFVGAGHWWFVAQVSRAWKMSYQNVEVYRWLDPFDDYACFTCTADMTLTRAVFASAACCSLATEPNVNGALRLDDPYWLLQRYGGQFCDLETLQLAVQRGLTANDYVLQGAAESGSLSKVQWLHEMRQLPLPSSIGHWAAKGGNLELLTWLSERGCKFDMYACTAAAAVGHKPVLCYLRERGCEWDEHTAAAAAEHGHLALLKWLVSAGCPFDSTSLCADAAYSGSVEVMVYVRQLGCKLNADVMQTAAERGRLSMFQYLRAEGCAWESTAPKWAARHGHLDLLRWLHEQGCPWVAADVCYDAAEGGAHRGHALPAVRAGTSNT